MCVCLPPPDLVMQPSSLLGLHIRAAVTLRSNAHKWPHLVSLANPQPAPFRFFKIKEMHLTSSICSPPHPASRRPPSQRDNTLNPKNCAGCSLRCGLLSYHTETALTTQIQHSITHTSKDGVWTAHRTQTGDHGGDTAVSTAAVAGRVECFAHIP